MKESPSSSMATESNKAYVAMFFVQVVYAGMALFSKAAISKGMNPFVFVVYRQALATLALAPLAYFFERKGSARLSYILLGKIFLVSLFGLTPSLNLYYIAINYTSATFAAASTNAIPAITFIMALLFRMESISIKQWHGVAKLLGSVLCVSGALLFAFVKGPALKFLNNSPNSTSEKETSIDISSKADFVKGSLVMVSANTAWSLWLILQVPIIKQYPSKLRLTTLQCLFSCLQSAVWAVAMERNASSWKLGWDINLLSVAYCGVIVTGVTYWLQIWAIEKKGPVFTAMFTPLALTITIVFSAIFWKEIPHLGSVCGGCLLVVGLYGVLWGKNKEAQMLNIISEQKLESKQEIVLESITHQ